MARLRHSALPRVIDHFMEGYGHYFVMEFIEGEDLGDKLQARGQPLSVDEVVALGDQLLQVLEYLHGQQPTIIHRDIKPQNLKVMSDGSLILLDFGLAKGGLTQQNTYGSRSLFGYSVGYAPPEQMNAQGTDQRSDLYSVAATLWTLLTAQRAIDAQVREQAATYLLIGGGLPIAWFLTGTFGDREYPQAKGMKAGILVGFLAVFMTGFVVGIEAGVTIGLIAGAYAGFLAVISVGFTVRLVIGIAVGIAMGLATGIVILVQNFIVLIIIGVLQIFSAGVVAGLAGGFEVGLAGKLAGAVEKSLKTGRPSWFARGAFALLVAIHTFLMWFCFFGGWQVFVQ